MASMISSQVSPSPSMIPVLVTMASKPISLATERPWVRTWTDRSHRARRRTGRWRRGTVSTL